MIQGFSHKGLRRLFEKGEFSGLSAEHVAKLENILAVLNRARRPSDMDLPGFKLHRLKGDLKDFWSVTVRANWRVIFASRKATLTKLIWSTTTERKKIMRMKKPPHPGRIVRQECIEPLNLTVREAAARLGVTRQTLSNLVNEKAGVSPEMSIRLSKAFGSSPEVWLGLQMEYDLAQAEKESSHIKVRRIA